MALSLNLYQKQHFFVVTCCKLTTSPCTSSLGTLRKFKVPVIRFFIRPQRIPRSKFKVLKCCQYVLSVMSFILSRQYPDKVNMLQEVTEKMHVVGMKKSEEGEFVG